jgi:cytochrome c-type biogenesis protein CcmH/NrfF
VRICVTRLGLGLLVAAGLGLGWPRASVADVAPASGAASEVQAAAADTPGEPGPPAWAYALAHDLMSPFCPGRTLAACPSPQADELRQWIVFQAVAGRSRDDIEKSLYDRYGDAILAAPRAEGWGLSAYVVPALAFVLGGGLVVFALSRLVARAAPAPAPVTARAERAVPAAGAPPVPSDAELERLVDEELSRL